MTFITKSKNDIYNPLLLTHRSSKTYDIQHSMLLNASEAVCYFKNLVFLNILAKYGNFTAYFFFLGLFMPCFSHF